MTSWQSVEKVRSIAIEERSFSTRCIKTGFLPKSALPPGQTRETEQAVKILFSIAC
jgi:hypothetical protein